MYAQAYFDYDSKKSGGVTMSHLRFGKQPIKSTYSDRQGRLRGLPQPRLPHQVRHDGRPQGGRHLPAQHLLRPPRSLKNELPAVGQARTWPKSNVPPLHHRRRRHRPRSRHGRPYQHHSAGSLLQADRHHPRWKRPSRYMKDAATKTYGSQGRERCGRATTPPLTEAFRALWRCRCPSPGRTLRDDAAPAVIEGQDELHKFVRRGHGAHATPRRATACRCPPLPTEPTAPSRWAPPLSKSAASPSTCPCGSPTSCIQCNLCSYVCPHAAIRPVAMTQQEADAAPASLKSVPMTGKDCQGPAALPSPSLRLDCTGCGSCVTVCPAKEKALVMAPLAERSGRPGGL